MEQQHKKSWFGRNWPWVLPVGGCLTIIVLLFLGVGTLFFGVNKMFSNSEPYNHAVELALNNDEVIEVLGEPIKTESITSGNINLSGDDGEADFKIPIEGPNGEARIYVVATKTYGKWTYEKLLVVIKDTHEEINLQAKSIEGD